MSQFGMKLVIGKNEMRYINYYVLRSIEQRANPLKGELGKKFLS